MERTFEAYYSKHGAWLFLAMVILFVVGIVLLSVFWLPDISLGMIIILSICSVIFLWVFFNTLKKEGVAVTVENGNIVLHKKSTLIIPMDEIKYVTFSEFVSFELEIYHAHGMDSIYCFIKEHQKKKQELIQLLEDSGIKVKIVDVPVAD